MTEPQWPQQNQPEGSGQFGGQAPHYGESQYGQSPYGQSQYGQPGQSWPAQGPAQSPNQSPAGAPRPKAGPPWPVIVPWVLSAALATALVVVLVVGKDDPREPIASDPTLPSGASPPSSANRTVTSSPPSSTSSGPATNDRGNIELEFGDEALVIDEDSGETVVTVVVEQITPDIPCTEPYADPAENGHLTAVQISATTTPELSADSYFSVSPYDFTFIGSDGRTVSELSTYAAYSCVASSTQFPNDQLAPGSQYSGVVVLDLPDASGVLIFSPSSFYGTAGWEWSF